MSTSDLNEHVTARTMIELDALYDTIFTHVSTATDHLPIPAEQIQRCLTRDGNHRVYHHLAKLAAHALHTVFEALSSDELDTALNRATDTLHTTINAFGERSWKLACELVQVGFDTDPPTADLIKDACPQASPVGTVMALMTLRAIPHYLHTKTRTKLPARQEHCHTCQCGTFTCPSHQTPPIQADCSITCLGLDTNIQRALIQGNAHSSVRTVGQLMDVINSGSGFDALRHFTGIGPTRTRQIHTVLRDAGLLGG
jgi:hypothetical protein